MQRLTQKMAERYAKACGWESTDVLWRNPKVPYDEYDKMHDYPPEYRPLPLDPFFWFPRLWERLDEVTEYANFELCRDKTDLRVNGYVVRLNWTCGPTAYRAGNPCAALCAAIESLGGKCTPINPKRYEGHGLCLRELKEMVDHADFSFTEAGKILIQDAPLLLAEVERLKAELEGLYNRPELIDHAERVKLALNLTEEMKEVERLEKENSDLRENQRKTKEFLLMVRKHRTSQTFRLIRENGEKLLAELKEGKMAEERHTDRSLLVRALSKLGKYEWRRTLDGDQRCPECKALKKNIPGQHESGCEFGILLADMTEQMTEQLETRDAYHSMQDTIADLREKLTERDKLLTKIGHQFPHILLGCNAEILDELAGRSLR